MVDTPNSGKLPDPLREIARHKKKLNPKSSVAKSKFVDIIISMRMQGVPPQKIEEWLKAQGPEYRIPATTIWRNTKNLEFSVSYIEELAERWGGRIDLDLGRELAGQIIQQRNRIDSLQRDEVEKQKKNPRYLDRRIRGERELLTLMIKEMYGLMKDPMAAALEALAADSTIEVEMTTDGQKLLEQMLLDGDLKIGSHDLVVTN